MKTVERIKIDFIEIRDMLRAFFAKYESPTVGDWLDFCEHNNFYEKAHNDMTEINGIDVISDMYSGDISEDTVVNHIKIEDYGILSNVDYFYPEDSHNPMTAEILDREGCEIATFGENSLNDKDFIENLRPLLIKDNRASFDDIDYEGIAKGILKGEEIYLGFVDEKEMTKILETLAKEYYNACLECKTFEKMQEKYPVICPVFYNSHEATPKVESLETDWEIYAKLTINGENYGVRIENNYKWEQFVTFKSEESNEKLSSFKIYGKNAHNVFKGEKSILPVEGQKDMKKLISEYLCKNTEIANRIFQGENVGISIKDSTEGVVVNAKNITEVKDIVGTILEKAHTVFYEGDDLVFVPEHDYKFTINGKTLDIDYSEHYGIGYWDEPTTELVITSEESVVVKDVIGGEDGYDEEVEDEFPCMEISYNFDNDDWETKFPKLVESIVNYAYKEELIKESLNPSNEKISQKKEL